MSRKPIKQEYWNPRNEKERNIKIVLDGDKEFFLHMVTQYGKAGYIEFRTADQTVVPIPTGITYGTGFVSEREPVDNKLFFAADDNVIVLEYKGKRILVIGDSGELCILTY